MKQFRTRIIALILVLSFILPLAPVSMASETGEFLTTEELVEAGFDLEDEVYAIVETKDKATVERSTTFFRSFQGNAEAAQRNVEKSTASIQKEAERKNVDLETNATFSVLEAGASIKLKVKDVDELQGFSNIESVKAESYIERVPLEEEEKKAQADLNKDAETKMYNSIDQVLAPQA